jgi:hypothetical protein
MDIYCGIVPLANTIFYCLLSSQQMVIAFCIKEFQNNKTFDHRSGCTVRISHARLYKLRYIDEEITGRKCFMSVQ